MKDSATSQLEELIKLSRETQQWIKIQAWDNARRVVKQSLKEADDYVLYKEIDTDRSISDIVSELEMSERTAYRRVDSWEKIGLISNPVRGQYDKIASLDALDIEEPESDSS